MWWSEYKHLVGITLKRFLSFFFMWLNPCNSIGPLRAAKYLMTHSGSGHNSAREHTNLQWMFI